METNPFKKRREHLGLTQRAIANAFEPQITSATVSAWENDIAAPTLALVDEVARVYGVSPTWAVRSIREVWKRRKEGQPLAAK